MAFPNTDTLQADYVERKTADQIGATIAATYAVDMDTIAGYAGQYPDGYPVKHAGFSLALQRDAATAAALTGLLVRFSERDAWVPMEPGTRIVVPRGFETFLVKADANATGTGSLIISRDPGVEVYPAPNVAPTEMEPSTVYQSQVNALDNADILTITNPGDGATYTVDATCAGYSASEGMKLQKLDSGGNVTAEWGFPLGRHNRFTERMKIGTNEGLRWRAATTITGRLWASITFSA